jgi:hypothetical protein
MQSSVTKPSSSAVRVVIGGMTMRFLISTGPMRAGGEEDVHCQDFDCQTSTAKISTVTNCSFLPEPEASVRVSLVALFF